MININKLGIDTSDANQVQEFFNKITKQVPAEGAVHEFVFDVNYINGPSALLKACSLAGIPNVDGSRMNLMQAAIAFGHSNQLIDSKDEILQVMEAAII